MTHVQVRGRLRLTVAQDRWIDPVSESTHVAWTAKFEVPELAPSY